MRSISCAVRAISGTSSSTSPPRASTSAIRWMYTSVLPDPVMPCSNAAGFRANCPRSDSSAASCAGVSSGRRNADPPALDGAFALRRDDVPLAFEGMQHGIVGPQQAPCHLARRNPLPVPGRGQFEERFVLPGRTPFELLESFVQSSFVVQPGRQGHVALPYGGEIPLR